MAKRKVLTRELRKRFSDEVEYCLKPYMGSPMAWLHEWNESFPDEAIVDRLEKRQFINAMKTLRQGNGVGVKTFYILRNMLSMDLVSDCAWYFLAFDDQENAFYTPWLMANVDKRKMDVYKSVRRSASLEIQARAFEHLLDDYEGTYNKLTEEEEDWYE